MSTKYVFSFIVFIFAMVSCTEENTIVQPDLTIAEINAQKLQEYFDEHDPTVVGAYRFDYENNEWVNDNHGTSCGAYELDGTFIKVCGGYYNLAYLIKFEPGPELRLYFEY